MKKLCVILAVLSFCTIVQASKTFPLIANSVVPAARGQVTTDKDKNGNIKVTIAVEHLASPRNLTPSAEAYVVWFQDQGGTPQNQGQMKVDKNLKGSFETVTPSKTFTLIITGERDNNAKVPYGPEVFRTPIQE